MAPVDNSDHNVLVWEMDCNINTTLSSGQNCSIIKQITMQCVHFVKGRLAHLDSTFMSASTMWDNFNCIMQDAIKRFVPICTRSNKKKKPLWMTRNVLRNKEY